MLKDCCLCERLLFVLNDSCLSWFLIAIVNFLVNYSTLKSTTFLSLFLPSLDFPSGTCCSREMKGAKAADELRNNLVNRVFYLYRDI